MNTAGRERWRFWYIRQAVVLEQLALQPMV